MIPNRNGRGGALPFGELGRLGKQFVHDLEHDYEEHWEDVIDRLRRNHPRTYIKLLLTLSPRYANGDEQWLRFENDLVNALVEAAAKRAAQEQQEAAAPPPEP